MGALTEAMAFAQATAAVQLQRPSRFFRQRLQRTFGSAAGVGFRAHLTGLRVGNDGRSLGQPHQGIFILASDDAVTFMRRQAHGDPDLIGHLMTTGPVAEFFTDQTAEFFAPLQQDPVPGRPGDFIEYAWFQFDRLKRFFHEGKPPYSCGWTRWQAV